MTIRQYLNWSGKNALTFARELGVNRSAMSRWLSGESFPAGQNLVALIEKSSGKISAKDALAIKARKDAALIRRQRRARRAA